LLRHATVTNLPAYLALHGAAVLVVSFVAGLLLHRSIRLQTPGPDAWHLAHAGGSARGVLLIALEGAWQWVDLPAGARALLATLLLFFVWTSTAAMVIAAATGRRGLTWHGTPADRTVFALYVVGTIAVFPAALLLVAGFVRALRGHFHSGHASPM
jgi:hypothetical protein